MKITAIVYNMSELMKVGPYINAAILMDERLATIPGKFDMDSALAYCLAHDIEPIMGLNKIMHDNDIELFKATLQIYKNSDVFFYVSDIGAVNVAIKEGLASKVIYNPETMITNFYDLICYDEFNLKAVGMSLEIPLRDVLFSNAKSKTPMIYQVFGHHIMFYSKRKLLSLYASKAEISCKGNMRYLKEEKREDYYPIIENDNGTFIYRSYQISLHKHINEIEAIEYCYFDSLYLDIDTFIEVLKIYNKLKENEITTLEADDRLNSLGLNISEGFTYNDSVYVKEEF